LSLVGDSPWKDYVKGRDSVGGDDHKLFFKHVYVAYFTFVKAFLFRKGKMSFFDGFAHEEFVWAKIEKSIWLAVNLQVIY
jgi:hypothetical protein